ncbi:MAG: late secretory pathway protein avl9 [Pycnora praestabilis]|nr:MAG: late secretory pathway protein avl9 [Pycnora praestabilis]
MQGSLFGPYTPLQQLDILADYGTKSYIVGSTNSLLLQQKDRYSDILINLDEGTIGITSSSLRAALSLSVADRRWIDFLTQAVNDTWDEANPGRPKSMGYMGSEEFIRLQFEEYLLALISSVKYHMHLEKNKEDPRALLSDVEGDPSLDFGSDWIEAWAKTENFRIFSKFTDSHLFDIVDPRHPAAGGLTIEDIQRRFTQYAAFHPLSSYVTNREQIRQVAELHLDERFNTGKEVLGKHLATGQLKVSSALNRVWADIEVMREAQRKRQEDHRAAIAALSPEEREQARAGESKFPRAPDLSQASASVSAAGSRAGAYLSSWGSWASEKRKTGWGRSQPSTSSTPATSPTRTSGIRPFTLSTSPSRSQVRRSHGDGGNSGGDGSDDAGGGVVGEVMAVEKKKLANAGENTMSWNGDEMG